MGFRGTLDPYGGPLTLVDKMIGSAYEYVKIVALNINVIKYLAYNLEAIIQAAKIDFANGIQVITGGITPAAGAIKSIPLPAGVLMTDLRQSTVMIITKEDKVFFDTNAYWSSWIESGSLHVAISDQAPAYMVGAQIRWLLRYKK